MVKIEMEMPKRCLDCPMMETVMDEYSYENTCDIIEYKQRKVYLWAKPKLNEDYRKRPDWCPLIEVEEQLECPS